MACQETNLRRRQFATDRQHRAHGIAAPARSPSFELGFDVGRGLASERRVAGAKSLTPDAVALRAFRPVERRNPGPSRCRGGKRGVVGRDFRTVLPGEASGDRAHFGMFAAAVNVVVQLALEIAGVEPGEPRRMAAVTFAPQAVTGDTGIRRAAIAPAHRDDLAGSAESRISAAFRATAAAEHDECEERQPVHYLRNRCSGRRFRQGKDERMAGRISLIAAILLAACDSARIKPNRADARAVAQGKAVAQQLGCGACHAIPGVWPKGTTGPSLEKFADRGMIAGKWPNRPDTLASFLLDPSGTAMPRQPMRHTDAVNLAAFLHAAD